MRGKPKGRTNQRAELSKAKIPLRLCMYGKELYQSPAVDVLEWYQHCSVDEQYGGGIEDVVEHLKKITGQIPHPRDERNYMLFQISVIAPLWKALCGNDAQFFIDLSKAIECRKSKQQELPQHYRLLAHAMNPKHLRFIYTYEKVEKIAGSYGCEVNAPRLLKDLGLSLFEGRLISQISLKEKRELEAYLRHK